MASLPEYIDGLPNICGSEAVIDAALQKRPAEVFKPASPIQFDQIDSACAIALHMHQPLIPAGGGVAGAGPAKSRVVLSAISSPAKAGQYLRMRLDSGAEADRDALFMTIQA